MTPAPGPPLGIVVARARGGVIGRNGDLPWREPRDMRHFRQVTMGHALLMGRRCHESIGRALPGRRNIVLSRRPGYEAAGCEVFDRFEAALAAARRTDACPFVIGGAEVYRLALPLATRIELTEIDLEVEGDVHFPALDETAWREVDVRTEGGGRLVFRTLVRATRGRTP